MSRSRYERMIEAAKQAARLGHLYHEQYKRDDAAGRERGRYYIGIEDALVFAGLAALSGVIGNATYDAIKAFIARLRKQGLDPKLKGRQITVFIQNVQNYHIEHTSSSYTQTVEPLMREFAAQKLLDIADSAEARGEVEPARKLREAADDVRKNGFGNTPQPRDFAKVASKMPAAGETRKKRGTKKNGAKKKRKRRSGA